MENIRLATENDFEFVAEFETFMSKLNSEGCPYLFKYTKESIPKELYLNEISEGNMYVIEVNNNVIGFYWARVIEYNKKAKEFYKNAGMEEKYTVMKKTIE